MSNGPLKQGLSLLHYEQYGHTIQLVHINCHPRNGNVGLLVNLLVWSITLKYQIKIPLWTAMGFYTDIGSQKMKPTDFGRRVGL